MSLKYPTISFATLSMNELKRLDKHFINSPEIVVTDFGRIQPKQYIEAHTIMSGGNKPNGHRSYNDSLKSPYLTDKKYNSMAKVQQRRDYLNLKVKSTYISELMQRGNLQHNHPIVEKLNSLDSKQFSRFLYVGGDKISFDALYYPTKYNDEIDADLNDYDVFNNLLENISEYLEDNNLNERKQLSKNDNRIIREVRRNQKKNKKRGR